MPDVDERLDTVEQRVKEIGERMDERFAQVDQRFGSLEAEVQKLRVLEEQNSTEIKRIAEVQGHHGDVLAQHGAALQRLEDAIRPLTVLPAALQHLLPDHERRITAQFQTHARAIVRDMR
jgi:hypothetical protein